VSFFSRDPPLARRLGALPRHAIHAFPDGAVGRIVGVVGPLAGETPIAPLTGRACVAWFVRVSGGDTHVTGDTPVVEAHGAAPFTVRDETGQAIVPGDDLSLLLALDVTDTLGTSRRAPPRVVRFLREHAPARRTIAVDWRLSWEEGILAEGQRVAVVGRGRREADPEAAGGSYRDAATRLRMERGADGEELFVSTFAGSLGGPVAPARPRDGGR
jgi:hypothetical protein